MSQIKSLEFNIANWTCAYGSPASRGKIKSIAEDFIVTEQLSFQPDGIGEHAFLQIEKRGENTEFVARLLARFAGVRQRDVSYAGLKDRHAITTQWFSIWLPGKEDPDWSQFETETIKVLQANRHARKLKRGVLSGNDFQIRIRDWLGDQHKLEHQLQQIKQHGFPNYFGNQRFGRQGHNVNKALGLFLGNKVKREQRSIYLSAARSYLFNNVLDKRIHDENWNQAITGDVLIFDQSNSYFKAEAIDDKIEQRLEAGEIHPTAMMFGKETLETTSQALDIENSILEQNSELAAGLIKFDLRSDRRALRVFAINLQWEFQADSCIELRFSLPVGSYATALMRELVQID